MKFRPKKDVAADSWVIMAMDQSATWTIQFFVDGRGKKKEKGEGEGEGKSESEGEKGASRTALHTYFYKPEFIEHCRFPGDCAWSGIFATTRYLRRTAISLSPSLHLSLSLSLSLPLPLPLPPSLSLSLPPSLTLSLEPGGGEGKE